jgi:intraflagellar transport protein 80
MEVALNQSSALGTGGYGRQLVIVDKNRDMWITGLNRINFKKMGTMIDTFAWNDEIDMIAAMADGKFVVWYYPNAIFIDQDIAHMTRFERDGRFALLKSNTLVHSAETHNSSHSSAHNVHSAKPTVPL